MLYRSISRAGEVAADVGQHRNPGAAPVRSAPVLAVAGTQGHLTDELQPEVAGQISPQVLVAKDVDAVMATAGFVQLTPVGIGVGAGIDSFGPWDKGKH